MKFLLWPILAGTLLIRGPVPAPSTSSPVTIDTSIAFVTGLSSPHTLNITVGNNSNRVLYVCVGVGINTGADNVTSVSSNVNGAFTEVQQASDGNWVNSQIWRLTNPSTGAHVITVTFNLATQQATTAISLYNVNQTTPNGTPVVSTGTSGTSVTGTVTLGANDMALGFLGSDSETLSVTTGTQRQEVENVESDTAYNMATNTGTGSVSVVWSQTSNGYAAITLPVNAAP